MRMESIEFHLQNVEIDAINEANIVCVIHLAIATTGNLRCVTLPPVTAPAAFYCSVDVNVETQSS